MKPILVVTASFYRKIVASLYDAAAEQLRDHSLTRIDVAGAWEIPVALAHHMNTKRYEGALALGCVIRGETDHYHYICHHVSGQLARLAVHHDWVMTQGIIMAHSRKQAEQRARHDDANYGRKAAKAWRTLHQAIHG